MMTRTSALNILRFLSSAITGMGLFLFAVSGDLRARPAATNPKSTNSKPKTAAEAYKNVQVLKDVPADDLIPAMQFITASLGVECDFCHVRDAFDKDDKKPKQTARKMMQMMFAINQQNFNGEGKVSCYSCHRGSSIPVGIPMVGDTRAYLENPEGPGTPAQGLPSANDILEKYVAALGGAANIEKISSRVETGTVRFASGPPLPVKIVSKAPSKQIMTVHLPSGDATTAFNGSAGWQSSPGAPVREMHAADFEGAKLDADLQLPIHLKRAFSDFKVAKSDRIGDHDTVLVIAGNHDGPPLELFFDRDSALLLRQLRFSQSPLGLNPTRVDYENYKEFDGVKVPLKLTITRPRTQLNIQLDQVSQNTPVDDAQFESPPAPPPTTSP
jgi:photosynthetic reaction center cytochrome c subunit